MVVLNKQTYYARLGNNWNRNPVTRTDFWQPIGTIGNTLARGAGVPASTVGNVSDFYIDTLNKRIYGPKTTSGWPAKFVSMVGIQGTQGIRGLTGATGSQGAQGIQGPMGYPGAQGPIGLTGAEGEDGDVGPKGNTGIQGIQGVKGDTGAAGTNGKDGAQGLKGDTGPAGSFTYSKTCGVSGEDPCKIGAVGPGGGWIFVVDKDDQYPGFTYLEAAPTDASNSVTWCDNTNTFTSIPAVAGWAANAVGRGQANTTAMLGVCTSGAANVADQYFTATKSDWFLPSQRELILLYNNLADVGVGVFTNGYYWSSTEMESNSSIALGQNFGGGTPAGRSKDAGAPVRAVRAF